MFPWTSLFLLLFFLFLGSCFLLGLCHDHFHKLLHGQRIPFHLLHHVCRSIGMEGNVFLVAVDKSGKEKNSNHQPDAKTGRPCLQARLLPCPIAVRTAAPAPFCGRLIKGCSDLVPPLLRTIFPLDAPKIPFVLYLVHRRGKNASFLYLWFNSSTISSQETPFSTINTIIW